jgi:hypothetical protein
MRGATLREAARPTARAVAWSPLLSLAGGLATIAALVRVGGASAPPVVALGSGAMAAALVLSWRDPASAVLAPLPASLFARRLLRLAVVAILAVPVWLAVTALLPGDEHLVVPLLALTATGVAVATCLPADQDLAVAAAVPLVWVTLAELVGSLAGPAGGAATLWRTHPWPVLAVALVVVAAGRHR